MPLNSDPSSPVEAQACWVVSPGVAELRTETVPTLPEGAVRVRTLHTAVSRGTEGLVFRGEVPASEAQRMRAPFQAGEFPGPVKYGYVNVGVVQAGPPELLGRTVFCLHPHQTVFQVPASAVVPVPEEVPAARAVLAGQAFAGDDPFLVLNADNLYPVAVLAGGAWWALAPGSQPAPTVVAATPAPPPSPSSRSSGVRPSSFPCRAPSTRTRRPMPPSWRSANPVSESATSRTKREGQPPR